MRSLKGIISILLAFVLMGHMGIVSTAAPIARAASVEELNRQKAELERQVKLAEEQAKKQKTVAERAEEKAEELNSQISAVQSNLEKTKSSIAQTQQEIEVKNQEVARLEAKKRSVTDQQNALLRQMYIMSVSYTPDMMLFSNDDLATRQRMEKQFEELQKSVQQLIVQTNAAKIAVETSRGELVAKNNQLEQLKNEQSEQKSGLASMQEDQLELKENAESAVARLEKKAEEARAKEIQIEKQISAAINAALARGTGNYGPGAGGRVKRGDIVGHLGNSGYSTGPHVHFEVRVNGKAVNPMPYIGSTLIWPVTNYRITQVFGMTSYASSGAYGGSIHTGIDLAGPYGQPVYAPADGTVILRQYYGGYGNAWVEQLDNGLVVLLGHMTGK